MSWKYTESLQSVVNVGSGKQLLDDSIADLVTAALDMAKLELADTPVEGSKYFDVMNVDKNNISTKSVYGLGLAKVNPDGAKPPVDKQIMGFKQTLSTYVLRNFAAVTREVLEDDRYGVLGQHARLLMQSGNKTIERVLADIVNRGFAASGTAHNATNLSALAEDGLALFADNRPQPRASAGFWGNLAAAGALTADAIATARLNFDTYVDGNGDLSPQQLVKVVVSPNLVDTMRELSGSTLKVDTSLNNTNIVNGIEYEKWSYLADDTVMYVGDGENGMKFLVRDNPKTESFNDGSDPDVFWTRLRMKIGTGITRPGNVQGAQIV